MIIPRFTTESRTTPTSPCAPTTAPSAPTWSSSTTRSRRRSRPLPYGSLYCISHSLSLYIYIYIYMYIIIYIHISNTCIYIYIYSYIPYYVCTHVWYSSCTLLHPCLTCSIASEVLPQACIIRAAARGKSCHACSHLARQLRRHSWRARMKLAAASSHSKNLHTKTASVKRHVGFDFLRMQGCLAS